LVYPGLHVYIYRVLHLLTSQGEDIFTAQLIFAALYVASLAVVMACYRNAKAPPYIFPLLILSKRLHSIFILRLFNDCFTVFFLYLAIYFYQKRSWSLGSTFFTAGLGVKMNILLTAPAIAFVLLQSIGVDRSITQGLLVAQSQVSDSVVCHRQT
jgi:alpha-1,3-mannosyltransferase